MGISPKVTFFDLDMLANGVLKNDINRSKTPAVISGLSFDSAGLNFVEVRTGGGDFGQNRIPS